MKILTAEQIKRVDEYTIQHEPVTSIDLMERAARSCLFRILKHSDDDTEFVIMCGTKNNGGDGLAIARMLADRGINVKVVIIHFASSESSEFSENLKRLVEQKKTTIDHIRAENELSQLDINGKLVIDALIGTGLKNKAEGLLAAAIELINNSKCKAIAIDIPSGMIPDADNEKNTIVKANLVLTFQTPKYAFFFPENYVYCGSFEVLDIGLDQDAIENQDTKNYFATKEFIPQLLLHRSKTAHKGNFGSALLICGSHGKMGAAQLSAKACLRSGAGILTVHIPKCGYDSMQSALPEAMVSCSTEENYIDTLPDLSAYTSIGIGCGIGTDKQTQNIVKLLIQNSTKPLVIDADALNILAENKTWLSFLP
ncbi:MAG TPA: NAD(P)H-hydrate epimerase, partial [Bacteroidia bacterium]